MSLNTWLSPLKRSRHDRKNNRRSGQLASNRRRLFELLEDRRLLAADFAPAVDYAAGNSVSMQAADLGNDGKLDLIVADRAANAVSVLIANGDGTFQPKVDYPVGDAPVSVVLADFDGDNKLDAATTNSTSKNVSLLRGNGDGTFQPVVHFALPQSDYTSSLATGDFDLDGNPDLVVSYNTTTSKTVTVLLNDGLGGFSAGTGFDTGHSRTPDVLVSDFNGDKKPDLVISTQRYGFLSETLSVVVLPGNGDGTFGDPIDTPFPSQPQQNYPQGMALGDFNDDGKVDVVTANYAYDKATVLLGNGNGTFQTPVTYKTGDTAFGVAVGDFDHDGNEDFAVTDQSGSTVGCCNSIRRNHAAFA